MTSTNIYRFWVAVEGTYNSNKGESLDRLAGALVYPSQDLTGARDHLRDLHNTRNYKGSPAVVVELKPPATRSGARDTESKLRKLFEGCKIVSVTDIKGNKATLPPKVRRIAEESGSL